MFKQKRRKRRLIPHHVKRRLYVEQNTRCFYCDCICTPSDGELIPFHKQPKDFFTLDHLTPLCRGGSNDNSNLVGACKECNVRKGKMTLVEFKASLKRKVIKPIYINTNIILAVQVKQSFWFRFKQWIKRMFKFMV